MAWSPIAGLPPQFVDSNGDPYSGAVLKFYADGTSTNIPIATDNTGGTQANSVVLNAAGYPTVSSTVIIPHIDQDYKIALYPTQAAADADSGAIWSYDSVAFSTLNVTLATLGVTSTAAELNALDGIPATLTATELGYMDGVTSAVQTQLDAKLDDLGGATVDGEIVLWNGTGGDDVKRATGTGIATVTSGVLGTAVSGTDLKTINGSSIIGSGDLTTAGGALIYLSTVAASGSSTVDVETGFGSTYDDYLIVASGITHSGTFTSLGVRWKIGGSYDTGSNYSYDSESVAASTSQSSILVANGLSDSPFSLTYKVSDVNSGIVKSGSCLDACQYPSGAVLQAEPYSGSNTGTGAITGVRFFLTGGGTLTGNFRLYGITKA